MKRSIHIWSCQSMILLLHSHKMFYDRTWKKWPFNTSDCLIEVTVWAGLTVIVLSLWKSITDFSVVNTCSLDAYESVFLPEYLIKFIFSVHLNPNLLTYTKTKCIILNIYFIGNCYAYNSLVLHVFGKYICGLW
jgi:hypothetical protein